MSNKENRIVFFRPHIADYNTEDANIKIALDNIKQEKGKIKQIIPFNSTTFIIWYRTKKENSNELIRKIKKLKIKLKKLKKPKKS